MITLEHVRYGHANNSSSSHSILLLNESMAGGDDIDELTSFGWEDFLLTSLQAKCNYLFAQLVENLGNMITEENPLGAIQEAKYIFSLFDFFPKIESIINAIEEPSSDEWYSISVDHQSVMRLPLHKLDGKLHVGFIEKLFKEILFNDLIVVTGGNDNAVNCHYDYLDLGNKLLFREITDVDGKLWSRYDPKNDNFALYNEKNGNKITMSFGEKNG